MRHTFVLRLRWVLLINTKTFYPVIEQLAEFLCLILPPLVCTYSGGGWAGVGSPYLRAYSLVKQMARIWAFWMNLKPAPGTRSETMLDMGVSQGMGTIQSELLGGSAASGGGVGGGHGVRNGFSLDESEDVLTCGESLSSGMSDTGRSESDLDSNISR